MGAVIGENDSRLTVYVVGLVNKLAYWGCGIKVLGKLPLVVGGGLQAHVLSPMS